jgi:6-phosphogluconolactonase
MLIGGYTPDKGQGTGIAVVDDLEVTRVVPCPSPSWIARHPDRPVLYAVAEEDEGGVAAWALVHGAPREPLGTGATGGADPCHLTVDRSGRFLVTANYTGGSVSVHRLDARGGIGERTDLRRHERHGDLPRQRGAHPHMVSVHGDELLVTDLGGDAVYRYALSDDGRLTEIAVVAVPPGTGPRHLLAVGDVVYVLGELTAHVLVYDADWRLRGAVPTSVSDAENYPSELAYGDGFLYVANRGPDTVTVFALDGDLPRYVTEVPTGESPRHMALHLGTLWVANERSHEVTVHPIDPATGVPELVARIPTASATCVLP